MAIVAIAARLAAQLWLGLYANGDPWEYDAIARNLVEGHGFTFFHLGTTYRAYTAPVYPLLLAATHLLAGPSAIGPGILQLALGALLSLTAYAIARQASLGQAVATLAGLFVALHPGLLVYAAKLHALNLDALLLAALVLLLLIVLRQRRLPAREAIFLGGLAGVVVLQRITFAPTVVLALASLLARAVDRRAVARAALLTIVVAGVVVGPWLARNALELGSPMILSTGGQTLWIGNNPGSTGGALALDGRAMIDTAPALRDALFGRPELEQDRRFRDAALTYMAADPWRTVRTTFSKLGAFWWFGATEGALYPAVWQRAYTAYYVAVLALGLVGIAALARRRAWDLLFVLASALASISLAQAAVYVEGRHRWEVEPLLLILAAAGAVSLAQRARSRAR